MQSKIRNFLITIAIITCLIIACDEMNPLDVLNEIEPVEVTDLTDEAWTTIEYQLEHSGISFADDPGDELLKMDQREFYNRYVDADGITIIGNDATLDVHFQSARKVILLMTAKHPELRDAFKDGWYVIVAGGIGDIVPSVGWGYPRYKFDHTKADSSHLAIVPEFRRKGFSWAGTVVGHRLPPQIKKPRPAPVIMIGWIVGHAVSSRDGVRHSSMSVIVHEFAHALEIALKFYDPDFPTKLEKAFENAKEKGLWAEYHVSHTRIQHFFTGVLDIWFFRIGRIGLDTANVFESIEDFIEYDPVAAELIQEWFYHYPFQDLFSAENLLPEIEKQ